MLLWKSYRAFLHQQHRRLTDTMPMVCTPVFWSSVNVLSLALTPFSWLYGLGVTLRQRLVQPQIVSAPVLCVGNLIAGGAGKTPATIAIVRLLKSLGKHPFVVSRGYGGSMTGPVQVDPALHRAAEVGDEPLILAAHTPTIVSKNRVSAAHYAIARGADVVVMDDGFQNPALHKTVSLVVIDGAYGFGNGLLLPAGPLREPVQAGLGRADAVIFVGEDQAQVCSHLPSALPLVSASLRMIPPAVPPTSKTLLAFAGIARPEKFFNALKALGYLLAESYSFSDHHAYRAEELTMLREKAAQRQALLATTAKDAARLPETIRSQILIFDVEMVFSDVDVLQRLLTPVLTA